VSWLASAAGRLALAAGLGAALLALGLVWHGFAVAGHDRALLAERDAAWTARLAAAEAEARRGVRAKEEAAYQAGVAEAEARRAADAAETETAVQIVREVVHVSASAASCRFDDAAAAGLNRLRQP